MDAWDAGHQEEALNGNTYQDQRMKALMPSGLSQGGQPQSCDYYGCETGINATSLYKRLKQRCNLRPVTQRPS